MRENIIHFNRCRDIAAGMVYLSASSIIHSDLAARNVLIVNKETQFLAKIGDLGLSKIVRNDKNYYISNTSQIPFKWYG